MRAGAVRARVDELAPRILYSADAAALVGTEQVAVIDEPAIEQVAVAQRVQHADDVSRRELVVIDAGLDDAETLLADFAAQQDEQRSIEFLALERGQDGVATISGFLQAADTRFDAIHIVTHGNRDGFALGQTMIDADGLRAESLSFATWGASLSADADLLIYGCELAADESGRALIADLAALTGADVAASDDITGSAELGGDWTLEHRSGPLETQALTSSWQGRLDFIPASSETRVNDAGGGSHMPQQFSSGQVATNGASTVVVWENGDNIRFRIYGANDSGGQQLVLNGSGSGPNINNAKRDQPAVAMAASGDFVIVWSSDNGNGGIAVYGQLFAADGTPIASPVQAAGEKWGNDFEFRLNDIVAGDHVDPAVVMRDDGSFLASWTSTQTAYGSHEQIVYRLFGASGAAVGPSQTATTDASTDPQSMSRIAWDPVNSRFALSFIDSQAGQQTINMVGLDAAATPLTHVVVVNPTGTGDMLEADVAIRSDGEVVLGTIYQQSGLRYVYAGSADMFGGVSTITIHQANSPSTTEAHVGIALGSDDSAVVVFHDGDRDGAGLTTYAMRFDAAWNADGAQSVRVPESHDGDQLYPSIAISGLDAQIVWSGDGEQPNNDDANGFFIQSYAIVNPGVVISTPSGNNTREDGAGSSVPIEISLASQPTSPVTVTIASSDTGEATVTPSSLNFTTANWATPQSITVTGVHDGVADGDVGYSVSVQTTSADPNYGSLAVVSVPMVSIDTDQPVGAVADSDSATDQVAEDAGAGAVIGITAVATDPNPSDVVEYFIDDAASPFTVDQVTGVLRVRAAGLLDFETRPSETVIVRAQSDDGSSSNGSFLVTIADANDPPSGGNNAISVQAGELRSITMADIVFSDPDGETEPAQVRIEATPAQGTLRLSGTPIGAGAIVLAADITAGNFAYQTPVSAAGAGYDQFRLRVFDSAGASASADSLITVNANAPPAIDSPGSGSTATVNVSENSTLATPVSATDPDGPAPTYSLVGGLDQGLFSIDAGSGLLSFDTAPDFENPSDSDGNNAYEVTVQASDGVGGTDTQAITVFVGDVNEAPSSADNRIAVTASVPRALNATDFPYSDPDGTLLAERIEIDTLPVNGQLLFDGAGFAAGTTFAVSDINAGRLTYLASAGATGVGYAQFDFRVQDLGGLLSSAPSTIFVDANAQPVIGSDGGGDQADLSIDENTTLVTTVQATDVDGPDPIAYSLIAGDDQAHFAIHPVSGVLQFIGPPDAESALDADGDNVYEVIARASDGGGGVDDQLIRVTVLDVNEAPSSANTEIGAIANVPRALARADFPFADPEGETALASVRIDQLPVNGTLNHGGVPLVPGATVSGVDLDAGNLVYRAPEGGTGIGYDSILFTVMDSGGQGALAPNRMLINVNARPLIASDGGGDTAVVDVAEGVTTVTTVIANDPDGPALQYRIDTATIGSNADRGAFVIDPNTGALSFVNAPDYEAPGDANADNEYLVTVIADDLAGGQDRQQLTVRVTPVDEPFTLTLNAVTTDEDTPISLTGPLKPGFSDPDLAANLTVEIAVDEGTLDLTAVAGLAFTMGDGSADPVVRFSGTPADVDAALGSIRYAPTGNANGPVNLSLTIADSANPTRQTQVTTIISVTPVNDLPVSLGHGIAMIAPDQTLQVDAALLSAADVEDGAAQLRFELQSAPSLGRLLVDGVALGAGDSFTQADIDAGRLRYQPSVADAGFESLQFTLSDSQGGTVNGVRLDIAIQMIPAPPAESASSGVGSGAPADRAADTGADSSAAPAEDAATGELPGFVALGPAAPPGSGEAKAGTGQDASTLVPAEDSVGHADRAGGRLDPGGIRRPMPVADAENRITFEFASDRVSDLDAFESLGTDKSDRLALADQVWLETPIQDAMARTFERVEDRVQTDLVFDQRVAASSVAVSTGVSIGYVIWLLRGGALISSIIASMPAWRSIDPLPVLQNLNASAREAADEESLESMLDAANQAEPDMVEQGAVLEADPAQTLH
ncbi:MAG: DUF4347 domain-containing protein [Burkholderiaceae bacterium]